MELIWFVGEIFEFKFVQVIAKLVVAAPRFAVVDVVVVLVSVVVVLLLV